MPVVSVRLVCSLFSIVSSPLNCLRCMNVHVCVHIYTPSCMYTALELTSFDLETSALRSSFTDTAISCSALGSLPNS